MTRIALITVCALLAAPGFAQSDKDLDCTYQAQVVEAVRQARIDRVKERDVGDTVLSAGATWAESCSSAIPLVTPWIYDMRRRDVIKQDLAAAWKELCLAR